MKRFLALLLVLTLLFTLAACAIEEPPRARNVTEPIEETNAPVKNDGSLPPEVLRAQMYGFLPEDLPSDLEQTISFSQFISLTAQLLPIYHAEPSDIWQKLVKNATSMDKELTRAEGALILYYTAREIGLDSDIITITMEFIAPSADDFWNGVTWNYPHIPGYDDPYIPAREQEFSPNLRVMNAAIWFVERHPSAFDGSTLLELDAGSSWRWGDPLTWDDAIKALVRLYESDWDVARKLNIRDWLTEESLAYFEMADQRKEEILSSPTEITVSGTAYYVSNDGSDDNDGRTPETPWATVERVNKAKLRAGDVVFFNRGDIWRGISLITVKGVTYSAYGEGSKPIFTASPENGAKAENWSLFYEDDTGKKIWQYHIPISDCGNLYFDDGNTWGFKRTGHWKWGKWVDDDDNDLDMISLLDRDLTFFGDINSALPKTNTIEPITFFSLYTEGPLYLRCDVGNPGEVFSSIEFGCHATGGGYNQIIFMDNGVTLDNLAILYTANSGLFFCDADGTAQNCEIGYCGGNIQIDNYEMPYSHDLKSVTLGGGCVAYGGKNSAIIDCYLHDTYQEGFTIERDNCINSNITISGSLLYRTQCMMFNYFGEPSDKPFLSNSTFEDNISLMSGFNWGHTQRSMGQRHGQGIFIHNNYNLDNIAFRNNTYVGCYGFLLHLSPTEDGKNIPIMENNTFCSLTPDAVGYYKANPAFQKQYPVKMSEEILAQDVGNDTNKFIILDQIQKPLQ